jgi:hypothetical protein
MEGIASIPGISQPRRHLQLLAGAFLLIQNQQLSEGK